MKKPVFFKSIFELRNEDFLRHPIWENAYATDYDEPWYDSDAADEITYRPSTKQIPLDCSVPLNRRPQVAASFLCADGTRFSGCCHPPFLNDGKYENGLKFIQPIIILEDRLIGLWLGSVNSDVARKEIGEAYSVLKKTPKSMFPLICEIDHKLISVSYHENICGFGRLLPPVFEEVVMEL